MHGATYRFLAMYRRDGDADGAGTCSDAPSMFIGSDRARQPAHHFARQLLGEMRLGPASEENELVAAKGATVPVPSTIEESAARPSQHAIPVGWPSESFISLNLSRSIQRTARLSPLVPSPRAPPAGAPERPRFSSPVMASYRAQPLEAVGEALCSRVADIAPSQPPNRSGRVMRSCDDKDDHDAARPSGPDRR